MKILFLFAFLGIIGALGAAGLFMLKNSSGADKNERGPKMAKALALRVGLSVALFLFILFSYLMGWIEPTGMPMRP
ncbi:DUF2909 domain-containing protein [Paucibacter sp. B2R-40]|uniref:DUF2909 domain-containing protein n=1 Tax=Paucibacter sp. B2R-40 TaxID=2893554 RepID=UPI0021E36065|nr:DUF2909 domain-containing protein [Paucibacter sp. B2R-40]MCV2354579.1 DUF2909 domain-containing protein [Paucibacter sp. B2R-40]